ncbi:predicted protein [Nematostella vectensis]|uniref:small monomeric GTPase n=1 Tax=Nematostella vectensis TaxID=45351 RepID=A7RH58_NEMVE|nr:ras-related and estrogen-regulated growth inhibitor [Nematostella vectensis]EDO49163.1 predicted protein [Nematostella vectensis]|eukprot:XP_001641226.1 predicted protein [Nematostella vectensis]
MRRRRSGQSHQNTIRNIRAVVLGKDGVGKSALTVRFLTRRFIGEYDNTLEATYRHHLIVDGQFISLDIMDTAGKNSVEKMSTCLTFAELFFIVYSVTDRTSFDEARLLVKYIQNDKTAQTAAPTMIIVANKCDLTHLRQVEEIEGQMLARSMEGLFFPVSVSEGYSEIQEILEESLRQCMNRERNKGSRMSRVKEGLRGTAKSLRRKSTGDAMMDPRPSTLGQSTSRPSSYLSIAE